LCFCCVTVGLVQRLTLFPCVMGIVRGHGLCFRLVMARVPGSTAEDRAP
jgi:hypothetical protein